MNSRWTFSQKLGAALALIGAITIALAVVSSYALTSVVESKDRLITVQGQNLIDAEHLLADSARKAAWSRAYLIDPQEKHLETMRAARRDFLQTLKTIRAREDSDDRIRAIQRIEVAEETHERALGAILDMKKANAPLADIALIYERDVRSRREVLDASVDEFLEMERVAMTARRSESTERAVTATRAVTLAALACIGIAIFVGIFLSRSLTQQIGAAIQHVRSSSIELQSVASEQAAGAKEQSTAMTEITTTTTELLATSRQIAESAQRVAEIARDTELAAKQGDEAVGRSESAVGAIRRQVDLSVGHMLELGKKSQQIGGILDVINELADQTNILSINAAIEAAGAGDVGRRFGVVADEIRKLSVRVSGSTRDIRGLIEEIRGAVNSTVMTTETASKTVDQGTREFAALAASLREIAF